MTAAWLEQAACKSVPTAVFFADDRFGQRVALAVCRRCPARSACLADALELGDYEGVRGGLTGRQRALARRPVA